MSDGLCALTNDQNSRFSKNKNNCKLIVFVLPLSNKLAMSLVNQWLKTIFSNVVYLCTKHRLNAATVFYVLYKNLLS